MRIDIDNQLHQLDRLRQEMGASVTDFSASMEDLGEIEEIGKLLLEGVDDVQLSDVQANSGGLLEYKGFQVVLYIPDQGFKIEEVMIDGSLGKKFHVMDCRTLKMMRKAGRAERYSVRNGLGKQFPVHGITQYHKKIENVEAELVVCKNCLNESNYKGYKTHYTKRTGIFSEFDLEEFFTTYSSYFKHPPLVQTRSERMSIRQTGNPFPHSLGHPITGSAKVVGLISQTPHINTCSIPITSMGSEEITVHLT